MANKHYNITVRGLVQGVFFRASTQQQARSLNLTGFVRNEADGSVYLEVEGGEESIARLLQWIKDGGPPQGRVAGINVEEGEVIGFTGFTIG